jgi:endonuclease/exonuclease/phosphatase (EEP) superfamily protein YafD
MFIRLIYVLIFGSTLVVLLGFLNTIHPFFDSLAHFRVHFLIILASLLILLFFMLRSKMRYIIAFIILSIFVYLYTLIQRFDSIPSVVVKGHITMMQFNLRFDNKHIDKLKTYLSKESSIDVATFQEVTHAHKAKLEELRDKYPYQAYCEFATVGGEMILSKYPFTGNGGCVKGQGLVWREIDAGNKKFSLVSLHLHWPYPYDQYNQITTLSKELEKIKGSIIVAGDFNAAPWSHAVDRIAKASQSRVISGIRWSIKVDTPIAPVWLPIDHILSSGFISEQITTGKDLGSDHLPILSTFVY